MKKTLNTAINKTHKRKRLTVMCAITVILTSAALSSFAFAAPSNNRQYGNAATAASNTVQQANAYAYQNAYQYLGKAQAKAIVLKDAGVSQQKARFVKVKLDYNYGYAVYDIEFYVGSTKYDYEVDAVSGSIIQSNFGQNQNNSGENSQNNPYANTQFIGKQNAKNIALKHAGISIKKVNFVTVRLDLRDNKFIYDIEFYSGNTEYDYEIDAVNGSILAYDFDIEHFTIHNNNTNENNSSDNTASETPSNNTASETTPSNTVSETPSNNTSPETPSSTPATPEKPSNNATKYIGEAKAKSIVLKHSGVSAQNAKFTKVKLDRDNGRYVYDIEFYNGNTEYEYEIDAMSGTILEYDFESKSQKNKNDNKPSEKPQNPSSNTTQYIGEAKAKSIVFSAAGISESQAKKLKIELDREDGIMVYEIEFISGNMEYEYEINAITGAILKSDIEYDD